MQNLSTLICKELFPPKCNGLFLATSQRYAHNIPVKLISFLSTIIWETRGRSNTTKGTSHAYQTLLVHHVNVSPHSDWFWMYSITQYYIHHKHVHKHACQLPTSNSIRDVKIKKINLKLGPRMPLRGHCRGRKWYHWITQRGFPNSVVTIWLGSTV